jgi:hypothetical protein
MQTAGGDTYPIALQPSTGIVTIGAVYGDGSGNLLQVAGGVNMNTLTIRGAAAQATIAADGTIWGQAGMLLQKGNLWVSPAAGYSQLSGIGNIVGDYVSARYALGGASLNLAGITNLLDTAGWYRGPGVLQNSTGITMINTGSLWMATNTLSVPAAGGYNMIDSARNLNYVNQIGLTVNNYNFVDTARNVTACSLNVYNTGGSGQITCTSLTCYGTIYSGGIGAITNGVVTCAVNTTAGVQANVFYAGNYTIVNASAQASFTFVTVSSGVNVQANGSYQLAGNQVIDYQQNIYGARVTAGSPSLGGTFRTWYAGQNATSTTPYIGQGYYLGATLQPVFQGYGGTSSWQLVFLNGILVAMNQYPPPAYIYPNG